MQEILKQLAELGNDSNTQAKNLQSKLILDLLNVFVGFMAIREDTITFLVKLLELLGKNKANAGIHRGDIKYLANTLQSLVRVVPSGEHTELLSSLMRQLLN